MVKKTKKLKAGQLPLSVILITKNEENNLGRCLETLRFAAQVVVVDSKSSDSTVAIAKKNGAEVYSRAWPGYAAQRNWALKRCRYDWVLSVDADECVSPGLRKALAQMLEQGPAHTGYRLGEVNLYFGRWLKHGGLYPIRHLLLFDRRQHTFEAKMGVHEAVQVQNPGLLDGHLIHYAYPSIELALQKLNHYTDLEAQGRWDQGQRASLYGLLWRPLRKFVRKYFFQLGFLDGAQGLLYCCLSTYYTFIFHAKLWERARHPAASQHGFR